MINFIIVVVGMLLVNDTNNVFFNVSETEIQGVYKMNPPNDTTTFILVPEDYWGEEQDYKVYYKDALIGYLQQYCIGSDRYEFVAYEPAKKSLKI